MTMLTTRTMSLHFPRRALIAAALIGATSTAVFAGVDIRLLEGVYDVEMVPLNHQDGQEGGPVRDSLTIRSIALTSQRLHELGFQDPATCSVEQDIRGMRFHCEQKNSVHGAVWWAGRVDADFIQGAMVWSKVGDMVPFAFQGKRVR